MKERTREMRWFLIYLACCGGIAIYEIVYITIQEQRNKKAK